MKNNLKLLTFNVCWECLAGNENGSAKFMAKKCQEINCRDNFLNFFRNKDYDVLALQEADIRIAEEIIEGKDNYDIIYHKDDNNPATAIIIYNSSKLKFKSNFNGFMNENKGRPYIGALFLNNQDNEYYKILSLHNDIHKDIEILRNDLNKMKLMKEFVDYEPNIIIMGDFNMNLYELNNNDEVFKLQDIDLNIKNTFNETCCIGHYENSNEYRHVFDNVLYSNNILNSSILFHDMSNISDHKMIEFNINNDNIRYKLNNDVMNDLVRQMSIKYDEELNNYISINNHEFNDNKYVRIKVNNNYEYMSLIDFYSFLESIVTEFIDVTFKEIIKIFIEDNETRLEGLDNKTIKEIYNDKILILGGKNMNNIISIDKLKKSFDFDIHLLVSRNDFNNKRDIIEKKIQYFLLSISNIYNEIIKYNYEGDAYFFKYYGYYLYLILLNYDLVDHSCERYYRFNEELFKAGTRNRPNISINSLFIRFLFKPDIIFIKDENNYYVRDSLLNQNMHDVNEDGNILYYPFIDCGVEQEINFGMPVEYNYNIIDYYIEKISYKSDRIDLIYLNLIIQINNLINYIIVSNRKRLPNVIKLQTLFNINNYNISYLKLIKNKNFNHILDELSKKHNNIKNKNIYNDFKNKINELQDENINQDILNIINDENIKNIYDIIKYLFTNIITTNSINNIIEQNDYVIETDTSYIYNRCTINDKVKDTNIFNNYDSYCSEMENLYNFLKNEKRDTYKALGEYTGANYGNINDYCINTYFNITTGYNLYHQGSYIPIDSGNNFINTVSSYVDSIDLLYTDPDCNNEILKVNNLINTNNNNEFIVYRFQNFQIFNTNLDNMNSYFDPNILNVNDILRMPFFLSATYSKYFHFGYFLKENTCLIKLVVELTEENKKKFIIIDHKAIHNATEFEVLFKRNQYYRVIEDTKIVQIKNSRNKIFDIPLITLRLVGEPTQTGGNYIQKVFNNHNIQTITNNILNGITQQPIIYPNNTNIMYVHNIIFPNIINYIEEIKTKYNNQTNQYNQNIQSLSNNISIPIPVNSKKYYKLYLKYKNKYLKLKKYYKENNI